MSKDLNVKAYALDLRKVLSIKSKKSIDEIHSYYRDMIHSAEDNRNVVANCLFNTLLAAGYIIDIRDKKIESLIQ